jgi:hypothetical protein
MRDPLPENALRLIAARVASILLTWLRQRPGEKHDNNDQSPQGMLTHMFASRVAETLPELPTDIEAQMSVAVLKQLSTWNNEGRCYLSWACDYHPNQSLTELSEALGIEHEGLVSSWPWKTSISLQINRDNVVVAHDVRRNHVAEHFVADVGWVVSVCNIDSRLMPIVVDAVRSGKLSQDVAEIVPFGDVA